MWAPTAFQGSTLVLGIVFAFVIQLLDRAGVYVVGDGVTTSGGEYVYQSRVFGGGFGFTVVFAFFVVWILNGSPSGWLRAVLGFAPR